MQLADTIEGKQLARKGLQGFCSICSEELMPKCGEINVWHWCHKNGSDCDTWSEGETEWHYNWKEQFEINEREIVIIKNEIKHRADICYSPRNNEEKLVVEIQRKTLSTEEIKEREDFYGNMCWIFDGTDLDEDRFIIKKAKFNQFYRWKHSKRSLKCCTKPVFLDLGIRGIFKVTQNKGRWGYGYLFESKEIKNELKKIYINH